MHEGALVRYMSCSVTECRFPHPNTEVKRQRRGGSPHNVSMAAT